MARQPRLDLPGIPQHIVQRGNNRLPCFLDDIDRAHYLILLREAPLRAAAYRAILYEPLSDDTLEEIRTYLQQQRALGSNHFQNMIQAKTQRFASVRPAHRPRKEN
ncbi:MAG: hypothetical protein WBW92_01710 [Rhodanobacteraceae bacterium]